MRGSEQVERGLHGVLIVEDRDPPPYSQDVMWVIDDWRLDVEVTVRGRRVGEGAADETVNRPGWGGVGIGRLPPPIWWAVEPAPLVPQRPPGG